MFEINNISRVNKYEKFDYCFENGHTNDDSDWSDNKGFWVGNIFPSGGRPTRNSESQDQFFTTEIKNSKSWLWKFLNF